MTVKPFIRRSLHVLFKCFCFHCDRCFSRHHLSSPSVTMVQQFIMQNTKTKEPTMCAFYIVSSTIDTNRKLKSHSQTLLVVLKNDTDKKILSTHFIDNLNRMGLINV